MRGAAVTSVASMPDGRFASGGADGVVILWKVEDRGMPGGRHQWQQHEQLPEVAPCSVRSLAVAGSKQLLVSALRPCRVAAAAAAAAAS